MGSGHILSNGIGSGGGYGGKGGIGCNNETCIDGGISYGDANLPCDLGSGSGNDSVAGSTAGGGILGEAKPLAGLCFDFKVWSPINFFCYIWFLRF